MLAKLTDEERQRIAAEEARLAKAAQQDANAVKTSDSTATETADCRRRFRPRREGDLRSPRPSSASRTSTRRQARTHTTAPD